MGQPLEAFLEGVQLARLPGLEQTRQAHARLGPLVAARRVLSGLGTGRQPDQLGLQTVSPWAIAA